MENTIKKQDVSLYSSAEDDSPGLKFDFSFCNARMMKNRQYSSKVSPYYYWNYVYKKDELKKIKRKLKNRNKRKMLVLGLFVLFLSTLVYARNIVRAVKGLRIQTEKYEQLLETINQNDFENYYGN